MNERETLLLLSDARRNIDQMAVVVRRIARHDPGIARVALPRVRALIARQLRLEKKARVSFHQPPQFGLVLPIIMGGMALLGLGGYVFKHHEETSLERYKLESIEKCIEENVASGMDRMESSRICRELFTGTDLKGVFSELSRTIMIASIAITGVYLFLRWKK